MLDWLISWWDGVELWVARLWFPFQFVLVLLVLLPVCAALAWVLDKAVERTGALVRTMRDRGSEEKADRDLP